MAMIEINRNLTPRQLRTFAVALAVALGAIGWVVMRNGGPWAGSVALWVVGGLVAVTGLAAPGCVRPIYLGLSYATFPIGWVISHAFLAVVYYGILTPIGLGMRLLGRDPMCRRLDRTERSYWLRRPPPAATDRYFRQF